MLPSTTTCHVLTDQTIGATTAAGGVGTGFTNATFITKSADQIYVIDWISYANSAAAADTWTLTVGDDNSRSIFTSIQAVTGPDNMFLQFVGGLPLKNIFSDAAQSQAKPPSGAPFVSILAGSISTGFLMVGYHVEHRAHRFH